MKKDNQMLYEEDVEDDSESSNLGEEEENEDEEEIIDFDDDIEIPIEEEEKIKIEKLSNCVENTPESKKQEDSEKDNSYKKEEGFEMKTTDDNQETVTICDKKFIENPSSDLTKNLLSLDLNNDKCREEVINLLLLNDSNETPKKKKTQKSTFNSRKGTSSKQNNNSISMNNPELHLNYDFNSAISKVMKNMVRSGQDDDNSDLLKQLLLGDQYFNEDLKKVLLSLIRKLT